MKKYKKIYDLVPQYWVLCREMAKNNLRVTPTARTLNTTTSSIHRWCCDIAEKAGLDPRQFYDLHDLLTQLQEGGV